MVFSFVEIHIRHIISKRKIIKILLISTISHRFCFLPVTVFGLQSESKLQQTCLFCIAFDLHYL
jgi:hypothetical protein